MDKILLINGPNINLLGKRNIKLYGNISLEDLVKILEYNMPNNCQLIHYQNNCEGHIVDFLNDTYMQFINNNDNIRGIIINPAAYTHSSIAIRDALEVFSEIGIKIFEVHLTNIFQREKFRHHSYISEVASGVIAGLGVDGYEMALKKILQN